MGESLLATFRRQAASHNVAIFLLSKSVPQLGNIPAPHSGATYTKAVLTAAGDGKMPNTRTGAVSIRTLAANTLAATLFAGLAMAGAAANAGPVITAVYTTTSSAEQEFLTTKFSGFVHWIAAADTDTEGVWRWIAGPESGQQFWQGAADGAAVQGAYNNWRRTTSVIPVAEPNNQSGGEDCARVETNLEVIWNDAGCSTSNGYVVEYSP